MARDDAPLSDELLARFAGGDDSALRALVDREGSDILRHIEARLPARLRRRVGASDILQRTVIELMSVRDRFENRGLPAFRKMLRSMAELNLARALARERAQKRDLLREAGPPPGFSDESTAEPIAGVAAEITTPSERMVRRETTQRVRSVLEKLSPAAREIIAWIDYRGMSYDEAARCLGLSIDSTRRRHSRAVAQLKAMLRDDDQSGA